MIVMMRFIIIIIRVVTILMIMEVHDAVAVL